MGDKDRGDDWLPVLGNPELTPEQEELAKKRVELRQLRDEVVESELKLSGLRSQVEGFAMARLFRLGPLYAQIDELQLRVDEALLARDADHPVLRRRVQEARARAERSREAAYEAAEAGEPRSVPRSPELKRLYREAARLVHPDLGRTPEDVELRHNFMVRLNAAHGACDEEGILVLLAAWEAERVPPETLDVANDLVRAIRAMACLRVTIERLGHETAELRKRPDYLLMIRDRRAAAEGLDLLGDLGSELACRCEELEGRLRDLGEGVPE